MKRYKAEGLTHCERPGCGKENPQKGRGRPRRFCSRKCQEAHRGRRRNQRKQGLAGTELRMEFERLRAKAFNLREELDATLRKLERLTVAPPTAPIGAAP